MNPRSYYLEPIKNVFDALVLKNIRNECRFFMTSDTSEIGILREISWYFLHYLKENKKGNLYCYSLKKDGENLGFAKIRRDRNKYWITGGLKKSRRGRGEGKILFSLILDKLFGKEAWLEVLKTNHVALNLYKKLGFMMQRRIVKNEKEVIVMKLSR